MSLFTKRKPEQSDAEPAQPKAPPIGLDQIRDALAEYEREQAERQVPPPSPKFSSFDAALDYQAERDEASVLQHRSNFVNAFDLERRERRQSERKTAEAKEVPPAPAAPQPKFSSFNDALDAGYEAQKPGPQGR